MTGGRPPKRRGGLRLLLHRTSDAGLALLVAGVVGMMILPLPTALLDVLIALNLTVAVVLLLVAVYVTEPLRIATFPTILLVTTLYRLGLNVSSTRLILLQADAGRVIDAFGEFVVGGSYVVGAVVFTILLVVQFVVIARGSERVAEVAARFALDALPGRQMAIDADLRAGIIDKSEARDRRWALQRESQFYGAMDGGMKFVKGDAVAGIVITLVNIVGGLAIGIGQRGMDVGEAMRVFGLLTIGDGLVSQIPALVISTAAGLVVTRVASEEEGAHLGEEIGAQLLGYPRALVIAAGLLVLLALVPGLPAVPFVALAAVSGATAYGLHRRRRGAAALLEGLEPVADGEPPASASPLGVAFGGALSASLLGRASRPDLAAELSAVRARLREDLGLRVPIVRFRPEASGLGPDEYEVLVDGLPAGRAEVRPAELLCVGSADELAGANIPAAAVEHPAAPGPSAWVSQAAAPDARAAGLSLLAPAEVVAAHVERVVRGHAPVFVGLQEAQEELDRLEQTHPALVRALVPEVVGVPLVAEVLRRLVEEGVSIGNLRVVLEALLEHGKGEQDPVALTELVRSRLQRQITHRFTGGEPSLGAYVLGPDIEDALRGAVQRSSTGTYLALEPELGREIVDAVKAALPSGAGKAGAVVLTQPDVRRFFRKLIEPAVPDVAVLSYRELEPHVEVRSLGRISLRL